MAWAKNAARRLLFVSLTVVSSALFFYGSCSATLHGTEVIKPAFFFSPLSYCGFQSLYQEKKHSDTGFKFWSAPYFSKNFSNKLIASGLGASSSTSFTVAPKSLLGDVDSDHLIAVLTKNLAHPELQRIDEATERPRAIISLSPEQKEVGLRMIIRHDLDFLVEGIFYSLEVSWARQTRTLNPTYSNEFLTKASTADIITIRQFFGGIQQSIYDPLLSLKLSDIGITEIGFDCVQATIGYNVLDKNDYRLALIGSVQLPCGPTHKLDYLFSPNIGTKHLQFGLGWHGYLKLGGNDKIAWYVSNNAMGGYNFPADEPRIPTIANTPWGHYKQMLANNTPAYTTLTPGPDMLPKSIKVKQGLSLQDTFIITYKHDDLRLEVGFSAAYREAEHNIFSGTWTNNTMAIPNRYINPFNFTGASNNDDYPAFTIDGKMYPSTTGQLPESLSTQIFTAGTDIHGDPVAMVPVTAGAWAQNMSTKTINTSDLELNAPAIFSYQYFASIAKKVTLSADIDAILNVGAQIAFGEPAELMIRHYQLWIGLGFSF